ncbi:MAG TPA: hemolysin family protein [Chitinophagales bacterium]|nr:hemolysin family protein [Chitinophagales bacterium]
MEIQIAIIALVFSAFFSGIEIAYVSANKLKLELLKKQGTFTGRILAVITSSPSDFLATTLIGNNIALIIISLMMATLLEPLISAWLPPAVTNEFSIMVIQTLITTLLVLFLGEFIPKALFRIYPDSALRIFAFPLLIVYYLLYPLVWFIVSLTHSLLRWAVRVSFSDNPLLFSHADLEHFITQFVSGKEKEKEVNADIFERALYLREVRARECMVPRTEIEAIDVNATIDDLRKKFTDTRLSRIIIYDGTIDSILGYVHHFDLLKKPAAIREIIFPIKVIPETMLAKDILNLFMKDHKSICWVVDEFGGTSGIVTLEDVLEEIFGEIKDEHDTEEFLEKQVFEDEFIFSGRLEVQYLNDKYQLHIPEGDYKTLAGFILSHYENIPSKGEEIIIGNFRFKVLNVSETRIESVRMKLLPQPVPVYQAG